MKVAIGFNHPYEGSYCNAILDSVTCGLKQANHETDIINPDKDGFNPVMSAQDLKAFRDKKPIEFWKLGYKNRKWISLNMVKQVPIEKRKSWLNKIEKTFAKEELFR